MFLLRVYIVYTLGTQHHRIVYKSYICHHFNVHFTAFQLIKHCKKLYTSSTQYVYSSKYSPLPIRLLKFKIAWDYVFNLRK